MRTETDFLLTGPFNRLNDAFFKGALASPLRKHITIAFLNAVMSHACSDGLEAAEIKDVEFLDREAVSNWVGEKVPRFDIFLRAIFRKSRPEGNVLFHIEVQDAADKFFLKRGFYYAGHDYVSQSRRGLNYRDFEPVIFVGLANFSLAVSGKADSFHEWYNLHKVLNTVTKECDFDFMELHMAELPLLRRKWRKFKEQPATEFERLLFYFGNVGGKTMGQALMEEIAKNDPIVADLLDFEKAFRSDPLMVRQYIMAERAHIDYLENLKCEREEGLEEGRNEGREEGREEGRNEERIDTIRNMRSKGAMADEQIAYILNLPLEFVKSV